jgi:hypothetical protein
VKISNKPIKPPSHIGLFIIVFATLEGGRQLSEICHQPSDIGYSVPITPIIPMSQSANATPDSPAPEFRPPLLRFGGEGQGERRTCYSFQVSAFCIPPPRPRPNLTLSLTDTFPIDVHLFPCAQGPFGTMIDSQMARLEELTPGSLVKGVLPDAVAELVSTKWHGLDVPEVVYRDSACRVATEILFCNRELSFQIRTASRPWSSDGDGDAADPRYVRQRFQREPDFAVTNVSNRLADLLKAYYRDPVAYERAIQETLDE